MKKIGIILLSVLLSLTLISCKPKNNKREPNENEIKDAMGRIIEIPSDPSEVRIASVYAVASPFFVALGISDKVVACNTKKAFYKREDDGLFRAGNCGNGNVDLEKLASYNATVLIHRSNDSKTVNSVSKLGIDVITITVENMDDVKSTLKMLGKYFGVEEKADCICDWIDSKFDYIDSIVSTIPDNLKKTALVMGSTEGRVAGSDMLQTWMIEKAGGIPVVDTGKDHNWINIGIEKVFEYNPEYLFITSSASVQYTIDDLCNNPAWSAIKAIINNDVYQIPCKSDSWDLPGLSPVLGTIYMLYKMYPEYISKEDFISIIDEYYMLMFNKSYTKEELGYDIE